MRSSRQLAHEQRNLRTVGDQRVDAIAFTDQQVLRESTRIGVDGAWRTTQIALDLQPLGGSLVPTQHRPLLLDVHVCQGLSARGHGDGR